MATRKRQRSRDLPRTTTIAWRPAWRIIPSRFPPIDLFERLADPADWEALIEIESLTNPRLRQEAGAISLVPPEERVAGPGASIIMAAFAHPNPEGSRFADASFGVFYCTPDLETAIAETSYHRARFMRATAQKPQHLDMRVYCVDLRADLHDIRQWRNRRPELYHVDDYGASQALARRLKAAGSFGIVYRSVRLAKGECAAVFRPRALSNPRQERHLAYVWDGSAIRDVYEKQALRAP